MYSFVRTSKYAGFREVARVYLYIQQNLTKVYIAGHATVPAWRRRAVGPGAVFDGMGGVFLSSPALAGGNHRRRRCKCGGGAPHGRA
jgi:hypothetical protein